ncbi:MAG: N-acetyltransferase family protein [Reichenbachiella sp.]|uniref:GNAT family N-acetyltransferase n=1 Tax=Reichenbachiella sp. TaxID=2184521 RepID=UPI0032661D7B
MSLIRDIKIQDAEEIGLIFNYYVLNSISTFELEAISVIQFQQKIEAHPKRLPWLVYVENEKVLGYAKAGDWKSGIYNKSAYVNTYESSVYVENESLGRGIGSHLYAELLARLKDLRYHSVLGGIALPNSESVTLHEKFGFRKVAHFEELGFKLGKRIDVGYWQKMNPDR